MHAPPPTQRRPPIDRFGHVIDESDHSLRARFRRFFSKKEKTTVETSLYEGGEYSGAGGLPGNQTAASGEKKVTTEAYRKGKLVSKEAVSSTVVEAPLVRNTDIQASPTTVHSR